MTLLLLLMKNPLQAEQEVMQLSFMVQDCRVVFTFTNYAKVILLRQRK